MASTRHQEERLYSFITWEEPGFIERAGDYRRERSSIM